MISKHFRSELDEIRPSPDSERRQIRQDSLESDISDISDSDLSSLSDLSDLSEPELIARRHSEPAKLDTVRFLVKQGSDKVIIFHYKYFILIFLSF